MASDISTAISGYDAAATQISVSANNIANQSSPNYEPQEVVQSAQAGGGVTASIQTTAAPVDDVQQIVQSQFASYNAQANLSVINAVQNTTQSLLNIVT